MIPVLRLDRNRLAVLAANDFQVVVTGAARRARSNEADFILRPQFFFYFNKRGLQLASILPDVKEPSAGGLGQLAHRGRARLIQYPVNARIGDEQDVNNRVRLLCCIESLAKFVSAPIVAAFRKHDQHLTPVLVEHFLMRGQIQRVEQQRSLGPAERRQGSVRIVAGRGVDPRGFQSSPQGRLICGKVRQQIYGDIERDDKSFVAWTEHAAKESSRSLLLHWKHTLLVQTRVEQQTDRNWKV